jgi:hypothetical protein
LQGYELAAVKGALSAHVTDPVAGKFAPKPADIIGRLAAQDGRPGAEEAWATVSQTLNSEGVTIVWTEEMQTAFGTALGLQDDPVAARMAFLEVYRRELADARAHGKPVKWQVSLGTDPNGREGPLTEAVRMGRLPAAHVERLLPDRSSGQMLKLIQARAR